jgi:hypothetical protein
MLMRLQIAVIQMMPFRILPQAGAAKLRIQTRKFFIPDPESRFDIFFYRGPQIRTFKRDGK